MEETKLLPEELEVVSSNNGMKMYLSGLLAGHEATPRSNLYNLEGKTAMLSPEQIRDQWLETLNTLQDKGPAELKVFQFDSHQLEKWGPQGQVAPIAELLEDIVYPTYSLAGQVPTAFGSDEWRQAKDVVRKTLHRCGCRGLSPVPYKRVIDDMRARDTLESNSGWPLFTKRSKPEVVAQSIKEAETGLWKTYPAIALFRNYNRKTRLVWMFPMSANLVEGSFFQPLQSILMNSVEAKRFLSPWNGFETVRDRVSDAYTSGRFVAASDFSSTDAHFQLETSLEVFDVLKDCFQPRFRESLRESIENMHTIPLVVSPDTKLTGKHGVSSGSNWTNFIETIFDWILSVYVWIKESKLKPVVGKNGLLQPENYYQALYAIGDDMSWVTTSFDEHFAERLATYGEEVGQIIKAEKTTNDRDSVKSLQRLFQRNYLRPDGNIRACYSTVRALKSLVYPERFHKPELWSKDMDAIRTFMILENCVDHPYFDLFVQYVAKGDPHLREFANYAISKQDELFRKSRLIPGLTSTYNQEKRNQTLSSFASVKLCAKL